jgi:hypothetical protein
VNNSAACSTSMTHGRLSGVKYYTSQDDPTCEEQKPLIPQGSSSPVRSSSFSFLAAGSSSACVPVGKNQERIVICPYSD